MNKLLTHTTNTLRSNKSLSLLLLVLALTTLLWWITWQTAAVPNTATALPQLTVITRSASNPTYDNKKGVNGFEYQLMRRFASQYGYRLRLIIADTDEQLYQALDTGLADIAMPTQPLSASQNAEYSALPELMQTTRQLIYRAGSDKPNTLADTQNKRMSVADNRRNREMYAALKLHYPNLQWTFSHKNSTELLADIHNGRLDYTLMDSHIFVSKGSLYASTRSAFNVYDPEPISWVMAKNRTDNEAHLQLRGELNGFFSEALADGTTKDLTERFYGHVNDTDPLGAGTFFQRVKHRLPTFRSAMEKTAKEYNLDWRLLAAIAYQESHWDPDARSGTGVRGMMMLTQDTANELGVTNRVAVGQSLRGGAQYLQNMLKRLPSEIKQPDRTWMALASYNVGLGHVLDARALTKKRGKNPNSWADVKQHLPLLADKKWYEKTQYGYARGHEPVSYVQNIRHFNELLEWRYPTTNRSTLTLSYVNNVKIERLNPQLLGQAKSNEPSFSGFISDLFSRFA